MMLSGRLKAVRQHLQVSAQEMAERVGLSRRQSWERYERGINTPSSDVMCALAKKGINVHWLLTGEGPMLRSDSEAARIADLAAEHEKRRALKSLSPNIQFRSKEPIKAITEFQGYVDDEGEQEAGEERQGQPESAAPAPTRRPTADRGAVATVSAKDSREVATHPDFVAIPRYDVEAAAGSGGAFVDREVTTGYYAFSRLWLRRRGLIVGKLSVITVSGDSMEPDLREGDLVLIDHAQTRPHDGLIYIVRYSDGLHAKYVQMLPGGQVDLISSNPLFKPIAIKLDEVTDFAVIGRVVASVHEW